MKLTDDKNVRELRDDIAARIRMNWSKYINYYNEKTNSSLSRKLFESGNETYFSGSEILTEEAVIQLIEEKSEFLAESLIMDYAHNVDVSKYLPKYYARELNLYVAMLKACCD